MMTFEGNEEGHRAEEDVGRPDPLPAFLPRLLHQRNVAAETRTAIARRRQTTERLQANVGRQLRAVAGRAGRQLLPGATTSPGPRHERRRSRVELVRLVEGGEVAKSCIIGGRRKDREETRCSVFRRRPSNNGLV